jgi:Fe/S biogenesis protein NfuA
LPAAVRPGYSAEAGCSQLALRQPGLGPGEGRAARAFRRHPIAKSIHVFGRRRRAMHLTITDTARERIQEFRSAEKKDGLALRIGIRGRGPGGFDYAMRFVESSDRAESDHVIEAGGFEVYVDRASADDLDGTTVDFVETPQGAGFKLDNPNPLWKDPDAAAVQKILDEEINPAVAQHGGFVTLLDVKDGTAFIRMGGGCQGCGMVDVTLRQGIEVRIREAVPAIREIIDSTDHAGGRNPYYRGAHGGGS